MSSNSNSLQKNQLVGLEAKTQANHGTYGDHWGNPNNTTSDVSASEAISNISSPDYQEEITMDILNARDLLMEISDPSDSDSTLLVSDPSQNRTNNSDKNSARNGKGKNKFNGKPNCHVVDTEDHKIIIQVKGPETSSPRSLPKQIEAEEQPNPEVSFQFLFLVLLLISNSFTEITNNTNMYLLRLG